MHALLDDPHEIRSRVRAAIVAYLREHPQGADTAAGIARWWLPAGTQPPRDDVIEGVLQELMAEGHVRCRVLPDGGVVYSAPPAPSGTEED